jgi:threonine dehydrogenase-like Zn-dependent dehydrogenase
VVDPYVSGSNVRRYGSVPISVEPYLWGGFSQFLYLHPNAVIHRLPPRGAAAAFSMAIPLSNGFQWVCLEGDLRPGQSVVVLGPGQQGLGCVLAAATGGASRVVVVGLGRDTARLESALEFGATAAVEIDGSGDEAVDRSAVLAEVGPDGADLVLDVGAGDARSTNLALALVKKGGRIVTVGGPSGPVPVEFKEIAVKAVRVQGVRGHSFAAVEWATHMIASRDEEFESLTAEVAFSDLADSLGGAGSDRVHVALDPWK